MKRAPMKSRPLPPRKSHHYGLGKRERNRRLTSLGLSRHDDEELQEQALAIVERFRAWTGQQPCCVTGWRTGEVHDFEGRPWKVVVQWAHVVATRGSWAPDFGTAVPLCDLLHRRQENDPTFFSSRGLDAATLAKLHAVRFFAAHPQDADWITEHAADGDAITLALAGLEAGQPST